MFSQTKETGKRSGDRFLDPGQNQVKNPKLGTRTPFTVTVEIRPQDTEDKVEPPPQVRKSKLPKCLRS